jgi:hypothetical protein
MEKLIAAGPIFATWYVGSKHYIVQNLTRRQSTSQSIKNCRQSLVTIPILNGVYKLKR